MAHSNNRQALRNLVMGATLILAGNASGQAVAPTSIARHANGESQLTEFDAPGAATVTSPACGAYCGTIPLANNDLGEIVGSYTDVNVVPHGFLRWPNGKVQSFDAPGAGLGSGLDEGTVAITVNDRGVIAGQFQDSMLVYHSFVRQAGGAFTTIDPPDAGTGANQGSEAVSLNNFDTVAGNIFDSSNVIHGFVDSHGTIAVFDPPGSVLTFVCQETCLNDAGAVVGYFIDGTSTVHGFMRYPSGKIASVDAPGAATGGYGGTIAASINARGDITGYFYDSSGIAHGFIRKIDGSYIVFDAPANGTGGTVAFSINLFGTVAGASLDTNNTFHGYSRSRGGKFKLFDAPGAGSGAYQGTRPSTNNLFGDVAGWWIDAAGVNHGFVWHNYGR